MFRLKEKDETIAKLQADFCEKKEECKKLETVVENQKQKNNVSIKIIHKGIENYRSYSVIRRTRL